MEAGHTSEAECLTFRTCRGDDTLDAFGEVCTSTPGRQPDSSLGDCELLCGPSGGNYLLKDKRTRTHGPHEGQVEGLGGQGGAACRGHA